MTARERWHRLHRARRVFVREQQRHITELVRYGSTVQRITVSGVSAEYFRALNAFVERHINPPLIVDHALPNGGLNVVKPRRLP